MVQDFYSTVPEISGKGTALLLVEQDTSLAVATAARFYCLLEGEVSLVGDSSISKAEIEKAYFGSHRWSG